MVTAKASRRATTRVQRLDRLTDQAATGRRQSVDQEALAAIKKVRDSPGAKPDGILLRTDFLRRPTPLIPQVVAERPRGRAQLPAPPSSRLISANGIALRVALLLLYVAQHAPTTASGDPDWKLRLEANRADEVGLRDLVGTVPQHLQGSTRSPNRDELRIRQLRHTLERLAEPDVSLLKIPESGQGATRFDRTKLLMDSGPREFGAPIPYRKPDDGESAVTIPLTFFTSGWIYVLENSELLAWLMFRCQATTGRPPTPLRTKFQVPPEVQESAYEVRRTTWNAHSNLDSFGLLDTEFDEFRRPDGTVEQYKDARIKMPHRFTLTDDGLLQHAATTVRAALTPLIH